MNSVTAWLVEYTDEGRYDVIIAGETATNEGIVRSIKQCAAEDQRFTVTSLSLGMLPVSKSWGKKGKPKRFVLPEEYYSVVKERHGVDNLLIVRQT